MIGTIKEYAGTGSREAGESDRARQAHLAYFTELTETAEPHLRRAEQLEWLAVLEAEHDNIGAAMRGAIAAGEAHGAMRLAARRRLVLVARRAQGRGHRADHRGRHPARRGEPMRSGPWCTRSS